MHPGIVPLDQLAVSVFTSLAAFAVIFRTVSDDPAEGVVESTVILESHFCGDLRECHSLANQQGRRLDPLFINVGFQRIMCCVLEGPGQIGRVIIGQPPQGFQAQIFADMEIDIVDQSRDK